MTHSNFQSPNQLKGTFNFYQSDPKQSSQLLCIYIPNPMVPKDIEPNIILPSS